MVLCLRVSEKKQTHIVGEGGGRSTEVGDDLSRLLVPRRHVHDLEVQAMFH